MEPAVTKVRRQGWLTGLHDLLVKISARDEQAFEDLLERVKKPSMPIIYSKPGAVYEEGESEIIFYRAMMNVWLKAPSYRGKSNHDVHKNNDRIAWAWISKILANCARDYGKGERRFRMHEISEAAFIMGDQQGNTDFTPLDRDVFTEASPESQLGTRESIDEFIASLNEQEYKLLFLRAHGMAKKDIAHELGVTPSRVSQIMTILKEKYGKI